MNIKEVTKIFSDEVLQEITEIRIKSNGGANLTIKNEEYIGIEYVLNSEEESWLNLSVGNIEEFTLDEPMLNLLFKIKTQWETYLNKPSEAQKAFDKQMETKSIYDHLKKMTIRKE